MKKLLFAISLLLISTQAHSAVLFSDDFNAFTSGWTPSISGGGHHVTGGTIEAPGKNEPDGWTGWINHNTDNYIAIVTGEGRNGTPALKIGPNPGQSPWDQVGLVKYLGPSGYSEIYIRFYIKYDDNWRWGNGTDGSIGYHKYLRLWQNVTDAEVHGDTGNLSSEENRGHVLLETDQWGSFNPFFKVRGSSDPTEDSVQSITSGNNGNGFTDAWGSSRGFIENYTGNISGTGYFDDTQAWHSIEFHYTCASVASADDGVAEIWFDGVKQTWPMTWNGSASGGGLAVAEYGNGINYITLHDNGTGNQYWPGARYLWIDNVVISTTYIGLDAGGNTAPTITVSQPDGVDDTVTVGTSYNVTYTMSDPDDIVTAAFYYDSDNSGLDGSAISGACATAAEGTGATCSWDTSGVTAGSYYIYGIADDGNNTAVNDYSPGQITINNPEDGNTVSFGSTGSITFGSGSISH